MAGIAVGWSLGFRASETFCAHGSSIVREVYGYPHSQVRGCLLPMIAVNLDSDPSIIGTSQGDCLQVDSFQSSDKLARPARLQFAYNDQTEHYPEYRTSHLTLHTKPIKKTNPYPIMGA